MTVGVFHQWTELSDANFAVRLSGVANNYFFTAAGDSLIILNDTIYYVKKIILINKPHYKNLVISAVLKKILIKIKI